MHMSTLTILDVVVHNVAYMRFDHTSKKREIGLYKKEKIFSLKFLMPILIAQIINNIIWTNVEPLNKLRMGPMEFLIAF